MTRVEDLDAKMAELNQMMNNCTNLIGAMFGMAPDETDETDESPVLKSFDLRGAVEYIENCSNIIIMSGAGMSTSAGIPDFRTPGTGLYSRLEKYNLPDPQAIFTLDFFRENPKPFFLLAKELYPNNFKPTPAHHFIQLLNEKGKLLRVFTQNIDSLERVVGIPPEKIVEAHGTFFTNHCLDCQKEYSLDHVKEIIFNDEIPHCDECSGIIKPDIVFFGENLPKRYGECVSTDFPQCDFLIIMGTSLQVAPFNTLISRVNKKCPRLLINMEPAGNTAVAWEPLTNVLKFDSEKNYRDVFHKSSCDDGVAEMTKLLGWQNDFEKLLGKKTVSQSSKTLLPKNVIATPTIRSPVTTNNSKPTKAQTTVTGASSVSNCMAMANTKTQCFKCNKEKITYPCKGCLKELCLTHLTEHQQILNHELNHITNEYNEFKQRINEQKQNRQNPQNDLLLKQIDQWERNSIEIIQQKAEECRKIAMGYLPTFFNNIEKKFNNLNEQIKQIDQENECNEINLNYLRSQFIEITQELNNPLKVSIKEDSQSFINDISIISSKISKFNKWKENAITVAGGNGQGQQLNQLYYPYGIFIDEKKNIFIADCLNNRIVAWQCNPNEGKIIAGGNKEGNRMNQLNGP
ncbi:unnamed protein product [Adineta steineri]|uniref:Deacetylase sirtuin-type domain-containing protein n=3 Tax=Adineta steineri TaxID=433720 RepID=A0A813TLT6_9BILA|nr:unnamed protein product [Adineta steineri]